jgi:hypothetical protein
MAATWLSSCTAALGPGYAIETQQIQVQFDPATTPKIHVDAEYHLRNSGNQPLAAIEVRLPGRLSFQVEDAQILWDKTALSGEPSPSNPRDTLFQLPGPWKISESHTLHVASDFQPALATDTHFSFTSDAFFLPSEGWAPELLPARGFIASGGVPPKQWRLTVSVPQNFLVHISGRSIKYSRKGGRTEVQATQTQADRYPFVIAGNYRESSLQAGQQKLIVWSRSPIRPENLRESADGVSRIAQLYNQTFGNRTKTPQALWIVECPVVPGCFSSAEQSSYAEFLGAEPGSTSSELASADTLLVDFSGPTSQLAAAAPGLAASWLGYGQNPGFYDQEPPLSAFPAFAASLGREAVLGPSARTDAIHHALAAIPRGNEQTILHPAVVRKPEDPLVIRAKGFLFFYALEDRYGPEVFRRAIEHMLSARRGGGFDLSDLIAAFEQETNQNVAEFVRLWMKHPGVPEDFRTHYESSAAALAAHTKENRP